MTEAEIRAALQKRGWTYHPRKRRERMFVYASHRNGSRVEDRYLAALDAPNLAERIEALPNIAQQPEESETQTGHGTGQQDEMLPNSTPVSVAQQQPGTQIDTICCSTQQVASMPTNHEPEAPPDRQLSPLPEKAPDQEPARPALAEVPDQKQQQPDPEIHCEFGGLDPASLFAYAADNLHERGEYDRVRRAALAQWAAEHQYKPLRFVSYYKQTYRQPIAAFNEKQWQQFLDQAGPRDIYYAFIAAYAPKSLQYYIEGKESVTPKTGDELEDQELDLITYCRTNLKYQGPHDCARRARLAQWAEQRGYPVFWYTTRYQRSSYHQSEIPGGKEGWTYFLEKAVQYDVYCCYIAACAPQSLHYYLEDAARRGEINGLADDLIWRPSDHDKPR